ncbi:MAG: N-ethylmaleimide reductase [Proteobacteria bacterium]|nr:N-ethylmaleimide reductase [Pseudomonadota bacterium]
MNNPADLLFTPFDLRGLILKNRIVMAPLTRNRAVHGTDAPQALNAEYYAQRASAGLIISEATQISPTGKGYAWTPGIYSEEQISGWKKVTNAVHAKGGVIFLQLWHVGRISHPTLQPHGGLPVAPSAIAPEGQRTFIETGEFVPVGQPRALLLSEIPAIVRDYRIAARNAMTAGFDGVEIHAANGYLIHQFLCDGSNQRQDSYGGSIENRLRFALEVVQAVTEEVGAHRTGIRLSPVSPSNGVFDSAPASVFFPLIKELNHFDLSFVHVVEGTTGGARDFKGFDFQAFRKEFSGPWMVNNGYDREKAMLAVSSGYADLVAFGKSFIANPDLVARLQWDAPLNQPDPKTFYGGDAKGYIDYPTLSSKPADAVPKGYHCITPSLIVEDAKKAIEFYKYVFGAQLILCKTKAGKIGHAELQIGDSKIIIFDSLTISDAVSARKYGGSPVELRLYVDDVDSIAKKAVAMGANLIRPPENMFYGDRRAFLEDPFGHYWFIVTHIEAISSEEMKRREIEHGWTDNLDDPD